jgi:hypothetical protein
MKLSPGSSVAARQDAIISAIAGYSFEDFSLFLCSALRNTSANIVLIADQCNQDLRARLTASPRVQLVQTGLVQDPRSMVIRRFKLALKLVRRGQWRQVLLCDSRDVILQDDPFRFNHGIPNLDGSTTEGLHGLVLTEEPIRIRSCQVNSHWIKQYYDSKVLDAISTKPVLCAGTILGDQDSMRQFLASFTAKMDAVKPKDQAIAWGLDQATLNACTWGGHLETPFTTSQNNQGFALSLHHETRFHFNRNGRLINEDGNVVPVIHQYDRFPWLETMLKSMLV